MRTTTTIGIARSAFGTLRVLGTHTGASLNIAGWVGHIFVDTDAADLARKGKSDLALGVMFACMTPENLDMQDAQGRPLFGRAPQRIGPLAHDEMYGFEPSLLLGASNDLENLRRVKALAHLEYVAQLQPPRVLDVEQHVAPG